MGGGRRPPRRALLPLDPEGGVTPGRGGGRSGAQRQPAGALAEAHLDEERADRGADDRLAVEALDPEPRQPPPAGLLCEGAERIAQAPLLDLAQRQQGPAAAPPVKRRPSL